MEERKRYGDIGYYVKEEEGVKTVVVQGIHAWDFKRRGADNSILENIGGQKPEDVIDKWIASVRCF